MLNATDDLDVSKYSFIKLFFTKVGLRLKLINNFADLKWRNPLSKPIVTGCQC